VETQGVLRAIVAEDEQVARFNPKAEGEPGFERELLEGFARLHQLKVEAVRVPHYNDRIPALLQGRGDLVIGLVDTPERRRVIAMSEEVLPALKVAVNYAPRPVIATAEALRRERVGMLAGAATWKTAASAAGVPESAMRTYGDLPSLFAALKSGEIGATVMSISDFGIAVQNDTKLQAGAVVGPRGRACWGVRQADARLLAALDEYIGNVRRTPTWSRLVVKYFRDETRRVLGIEAP
jgi:ABC-type amino acid transport substrate-binding protein